MTTNKDLTDFRSRSLAPLRREDIGKGCSSPFVVPPNRLSGSSNLLFQLLGGSPFTEIATSAEDRLKAELQTESSFLRSQIKNQKSKISVPGRTADLRWARNLPRVSRLRRRGFFAFNRAHEERAYVL